MAESKLKQYTNNTTGRILYAADRDSLEKQLLDYLKKYLKDNKDNLGGKLEPMYFAVIGTNNSRNHHLQFKKKLNNILNLDYKKTSGEIIEVRIEMAYVPKKEIENKFNTNPEDLTIPQETHPEEDVKPDVTEEKIEDETKQKNPEQEGELETDEEDKDEETLKNGEVA